MWTFSGLDNDVGAPAAVTASKEGRQKNASKKEVCVTLRTKYLDFILKCIFSRLLPEDSKCFPVIWRKRYTIALPMRWAKTTFVNFLFDGLAALLHFLNFQVAQHSSITGKTLQALQVHMLNCMWDNEGDLFLQDYVAVLEKHFPGRMEMMLFLRYIWK